MLKFSTFSGGVHPKGNKNTHFYPTVRLNQFKMIRIPMSMHIGPPCTCVVKPGDEVLVGQVIGVPTSPVAVPIHSSVSGKVSAIRREVASTGNSMEVVEIESDGRYKWHESVKPPVISNKEDFVQAIHDSGLVGLGGAGFPTYLKLKPPAGKEAGYPVG